MQIPSEKLVPAFEPEIVDMWRLATTLAIADPTVLRPHRNAMIEIRNYLDRAILRSANGEGAAGFGEACHD